jgi:hypothetical protein
MFYSGHSKSLRKDRRRLSQEGTRSSSTLSQAGQNVGPIKHLNSRAA